MYRSRILIGKRVLSQLRIRPRNNQLEPRRFFSEEAKKLLKQDNVKLGIGVAVVGVGIISMEVYSRLKPVENKLPIVPVEIEPASKKEEVEEAEKETLVQSEIRLPTEELADTGEKSVAEIEGIPPAVEEVKPAAEEDTPMVEEITPAVEEITLNVEEITPTVEDIPLKVEEITGPIEEVTPILEEITAPTEEVTPVLEEITVPIEEVTPILEEVTVPIEEVTPTLEEVTAPIEEVTPPILEEVTAPIEEVTPILEEVTAPIEVVTPILEEVTAPTEEVTPILEEATAPIEVVTPILEEVTAPIEEVTPILEEEVVAQEKHTKAWIEIPLKEKIQILSTAYENLRLQLDDTITTKNSAVRMLTGYIAKFEDTFLLPKDDPIYDSIWKPMSKLYSKIQDSISVVRIKESELSIAISSINSMLEEMRSLENDDTAIKVENLIRNSQESLEMAEKEITLMDRKLHLLLNFQRRLGEAHDEVQKHMRSFVPDLMKLLNLGMIEETKDLSVEDTVLLMSMRRQELIRAEGREQMLERERDFQTPLQDHREKIRQEEHEYHTTVIKEKIEPEKNEEMKSKLDELKSIHQNQLDEELSIRHEIHCEKITEEKSQLEEKLSKVHASDSAIKLKEQEEKHKEELSFYVAPSAEVDAKIADVLVSDSDARKTQSLWSAASLLRFALTNVFEGGRTKELKDELTEILNYEPSDGTLTELVSSVPDAAAQFGVVTEATLLKQFYDVKRTCKQVATVQDTAGSAFSYVFSYVKSLFVISTFYQRDLNAEIDLNSLGPYEILETADYCIQQGDLEQAAKLMSQLKGVPRNICGDWLKEVRLLLETKQSLNLLLAYASSLTAGIE